MRLGSLFDGSGTAPLCAAILGWEPVWASEIEPFSVRVTSKRFPRMKHLGDITKIRGGEIEPVDVIVGGSPCQDLSVAGKQAGLQEGTRSHLFYEMVRIIKEMRDATNGRYPRYIVWENVPGAFSSNQGRDFYEVLKAFVSCADRPGDVPEPPRGTRSAGADKLVWKNAGLIMGDGYSLGWRVLDAQYWGVPQRRRRIFLAVDLGGGRAREILFEREGLWRDSEQSRAARESAAAAAVGRADRSVRDVNGSCVAFHTLQDPISGEVAPCMGCQSVGTIGMAAFMGGQGDKAGGIGYSEEVAPTLRAAPSGTNTTPDVVYAETGVGWINESQTCETLRSASGGKTANLCVYPGVGITSRTNQSNPQPGDPCCTLSTDSRNYLVAENEMYPETTGPLMANSHPGSYTGQDAFSDMLPVYPGKPPRRYIVRRLTPMECCRLQGFPDWWVSGCETRPVTGWWAENEIWMRVIDPHGAVEGSDSAIYKMWGNGMALPCMLFVLSGIGGE